MDPQTLAYYSVNAADVASRYESIVNGMSVHFEAAFPPGGRVLDVGCGSGRDMALLSSIRRDVYGLDASEQLIAQAQLGVRIKTWTGFMPQVQGSPGIRWG